MVVRRHTIRGRVGSVRLQRLLAVLGYLVQAFDLKVAVMRLQSRRRLHAVLDCWARGDKALLTVAMVPVVQTVSGGGAARVLCMLRNRVLRWLVIDFRNASSDNLIAPVFVLAQCEGRLRYHGGLCL